MMMEFSDIVGRKLQASDGSIGKVKDVLFDDQLWVVRYLEVNTGNWLLEHRVLLSPPSMSLHTQESDDDIPVNLTKEQIENAPGLETDQPVSRQYETAFAGHYGFGLYWLGGGLWGPAAIPSGILQPLPEMADAPALDTSDDRHLRLASEVNDYPLYDAAGEELGDIDDFLVHPESWAVSHAIVKVGGLLSGRQVPVPTRLISDINWAERRVTSVVTAEALSEAPEVSLPMSEESDQAIHAHFASFLDRSL